MGGARTELTLGPNLFNWAPETWRDFYFRIADEAPLAVVYLGETICSKRAPLFRDHYAAVTERLARPWCIRRWARRLRGSTAVW